MRHHKTFVVLACVGVLAIARLSSQSPSLAVERQGDRLRVSAPGAHFIEGRPLEQLRNGAAVTFVLSAMVVPQNEGGRTVRHEGRFVVSYDLWEERFSVVLVGPPRRSASRLARDAAEAWCLAALSPRVSDVPAEGLTLSALLDILSRKAEAAQVRWEAWSPPLRLADLKDKARH
jgi:hypothetical protein